MPGQLGGVDGTVTRAAMVTQTVVPADNFLPAGVSFCACEFLRWGYWNLDLVVNPGTGFQRDRAHIATWVAGTLPDLVDIPATGTATFLEHLIGNVKNAGNFYVAAGGFQQGWNFATRTGATTITNFDNVNFGGRAASANGRDIAGTFANIPSGRTGTLNGSFFSGGGDPTAHLGGQFGITGTDYQASGTFASTKQ